MTLEIRPYSADEKDAFNRVPSIVFGNYSGVPFSQVPEERRGPDMIPPEISLCAFEDGTLASTYAAYPFVMRLNGAKAPAAGVTCVGTLPQFRRRGHLRKIMEHDFRRRYEQRMEPIAILLASIAAIYQRYGYAVCSSRVALSIDPRDINIVPSIPPATGTWREASKDELPLLQSMYRQFTGPRNGALHRAPVMWDAQVLGTVPNPGDPANFGPSLLAVYEEHGTPQAYVAYAAKWVNEFDDGAGPGQRVMVRDYVWHTASAYRAMWDYMKNFDLAKRVMLPNTPADDPAFDIMLDPRELHATRFDWLLGRIIDVERALPLRPYGEGRVVFDVRDEMCPWNADRWALEAGPDGALITRTKETPSLSLDVSALAQILFGQVSPTQAVRIGRAESTPATDLDLWDGMFRTAYTPFCPDGF
jgi:predicted acetyltransferase